MVIVVVTYYLLYVPALIEGFLNYDVTAKFYVNKLCNFLFFANALVNPFIYSGQSSEFNAAYRRVLRLRPRTLDLNNAAENTHVTHTRVTQNNDAHAQTHAHSYAHAHSSKDERIVPPVD